MSPWGRKELDTTEHVCTAADPLTASSGTVHSSNAVPGTSLVGRVRLFFVLPEAKFCVPTADFADGLS